jgi:lysophospholipase L1-like esterase
VLVLGGSTTYETGIRDWRDTTWVEMQRLLGDELGHPEVEIVNAGCGGWTSWESLIDLAFRGLALEPDLVVVLCGANDVHARLVPPEHYVRDNSGYRRQWNPGETLWDRSLVLRLIGIPLGLATENGLGALASHRYQDEGLEDAWLDANPPLHYATNLRQMIALCRAQGAEVMLATWPWTDRLDDYAARPHYQRGFEQTNAVTVAVAEEQGVALLDHAAQMPRDERYWSDGRHVNVEGGRLKARFFAEFVAATFLDPDRPR